MRKEDGHLKPSSNQEESTKKIMPITPSTASNNKQQLFVSPAPTIQKASEIANDSYKQIEKMGFDQLLSKFQSDIIESTDVREKCDNQLVDLRVRLCVSENIALRLHGCFDDILEDIVLTIAV